MKFYTNSGKMIDMENPSPDAICSRDIAHALSKICRAAGHFRHFYSVAQHSLNCMYEACARGYSQRLIFACLIHDSQEAYICDVPTPLKKCLEDYRKIEEKFEEAVYKRYSLHPLTEEEKRCVKSVDEAILYYEFKKLHTIPICFEKVPVLKSVPIVEELDMKEVEKRFYRELCEMEDLLWQKEQIRS